MNKRIIVILILVTIIIGSGIQLWNIYQKYTQEENVHHEVMKYKPTGGVDNNASPNSLGKLKELNPDTVGWITIPNTKIDYPFVKGTDNSFYLSHDIYKQYASAGTLFMDSRCDQDFSNFNSILYGHHMRNGSMFGELEKFSDKIFFDSNQTGTMVCGYESYTLYFFAYLIIRSDDSLIYSVGKNKSYFDYIKATAKQYRNIKLSENDRIVTLSTCAYEFDNARMVLLAKLIKN